ncbi:polyphosphoinositide phosphatase-like isoform X2 [Clavelina lepadiformis]|uniref:polyphosphoinositide phosphatase-like isoform X2 n=1 Tax=Clavelina lepadiformis TaxID=159417 RepID=UPI004042B88B
MPSDAVLPVASQSYSFEMDNNSLDFVHFNCFKIKWIQKLKVYEAHSRYYIVGSNISETTFRILKIDRTDPWELVIIEDGIDYTAVQMSMTLEKLHLGNTSSTGKKRGFSEKNKAHGIVGFVRFVEGYYMILITKQSKVAEISGHSIYKIEDTAMVYIPNSDSAKNDPDEPRYLKIFQTVDLSSNFYFSYSYDLTNTLQHNLIMIKKNLNDKQKPCHLKARTCRKGKSLQPCERFVWNKSLLKGFSSCNVSSTWILPIIHGHVCQSCVSIYGQPIYVTLIGRRSSNYAGTRFMKRGCNINGDVANEVETEQIVYCASTSSIHLTPLTSYVQHRGSVPIHWQQDISANVVPSKPPINITTDNPYAQATAHHFSQMMERFGSPIVVLNLVRKRERRFRESVLGHEYKCAVEYLNQFLKTEQQIKYHAFDMAHLARGAKSNVLLKLASLGEQSLQHTGFFQSKPDLFSETLNKDARWKAVGGSRLGGYHIQTGVLRTNCVDCLDRTNSAQFVAGKCALAYQLFSLGVLDQPTLEFDTDVTRLFEEMYEAHGDIIALQYGGSQLVHTIQSYRRTVAPWASHSRDIVTTLSRYYTNTFSDADKQSAINLFLGVFRPSKNQEPLWEISTDHYLHNHDLQVLQSFSCLSYTQWWNPAVLRSLPLPSQLCESIEDCYSEPAAKLCHDLRDFSEDHCDECVDWYADLYNPSKLTVFDDCFALGITNTLSRSISAGYTNPSPFTIRSENWQELKHKQPPTSPTGSSNESSDSEEDEWPSKRDSLNSDDLVNYSKLYATMPWLRTPTLKDFSTKVMYGIDLENTTSPQDRDKYERYLGFEDYYEPVHYSENLYSIPDKINPQSLKIYEDTVFHRYHVDRQFYVDYLNKLKKV